MRVPSGSTDRYLYFVAVDITDLKTRETGLTTFTVQRSRNGAAEVAYTTPTITEIDATTMPGVYALLIDEDTTLDAGHDEEEVCVHITQASMAPVTRTFELFRPKITEGQTVTAANGAADADLERLQGNAIATPTVAGVLEVDATHWRGTALPAEHTAGYPIVTVKDGTGTGEINTNAGAIALVDLVATLTTYTGNTVQTGDSFARIGAPAGASVSADIAAIEAQTDDIGAAGAGLTAVPWNAAWDAEVESEVTDALNVYDPPTNAEMEARTIAAATYATAANLATVAGYIDTEIAAIIATLGVAGAGLTALGDTRIANLDATVSSRMATYTQPTGFLAATFPSGTIANTTNITAGTITTTTNLTTNNDKTGYALSATGANLVLVDGVALPTAIAYVAAACAGRISGAGTATETFLGLDEATTRLTITVDASGNRSDVVYG